jgi:hypothetical protein
MEAFPFLARAKSRKAAARSPRLSPRWSALRTGGSRQHRVAESGQRLLSLRARRADHAAAESPGEQDLVDVAGEPAEIAASLM